MAKKWPETLYVRNDGVREEDFFIAARTPAEAVDDDGPTEVAVYGLLSVKTYKKITGEVKR